MSNGIRKRENEENSIAMLAAQRQLYNDAKWANAAKILLSVVIPFGLSFVLLFVSENSAWGTASYCVSVISVIVSFLVGILIKKKKELAATIQQQFDIYVYNMPWNAKLFGQKKNLNSEIDDHAKKILSKKKEQDKLKDWYPGPVDEKNLEDGILTCQRENCWWDIGLRKRYKAVSVITIVFLCVVVIALGIAKDETFIRVLCRVAFICPMIQWLLETITSLDEDIKELTELDDCLNSAENYQTDELQEIQKMIFEHRKNCYAIPNIVYNFFKNNDEDKAHRLAKR